MVERNDRFGLPLYTQGVIRFLRLNDQDIRNSTLKNNGAKVGLAAWIGFFPNIYPGRPGIACGSLVEGNRIPFSLLAAAVNNLEVPDVIVERSLSVTIKPGMEDLPSPVLSPEMPTVLILFMSDKSGEVAILRTIRDMSAQEGLSLIQDNIREGLAGMN